MSDIPRYDVEMGWEETASDSVECAQMRPDPTGDYVTYASAAAWAEAEYERGLEDGRNETPGFAERAITRADEERRQALERGEMA